VLPFANMSASVENEYFCDGLSEELLNALAKIEGLKVAARTSAFSFKGKNVNVDEIGRALHVSTILEGSVRRAGNRLRITVQLVNVTDGYHLWSERYDREMRDIFDVQDEITLAVVDALKVKLLGEEKATVLKRYTHNAEAYQLYLRGRFYTYKRTPKDSQHAIVYFNQAITIDPNYALAFAGLADAYALLSSYGGAPPVEAMPKAREAALKAVLLDNNLAEAHAALGVILTEYDYDFAGAEREFKRAIELNPNYATAHHYYAELLSHLGRFEEAFAEYRRALEIDPLSLIINRHYGQSLFYARQDDESLAQLKQTVELDANFASVHASLALLHQVKGNYAESVEEEAKEQELFGKPANAALIRESFAKGGWNEFLRVVTKAPQPILSPLHDVAVFHAVLGEKDISLAELNKAYENRTYYIVHIKVDPRLDSLRDDPRFQDLLRRVGFPT